VSRARDCVHATDAFMVEGNLPQHQRRSHLLMHWMPIFSFTMLPSLESSTASESLSASTFFLMNFFRPSVNTHITYRYGIHEHVQHKILEMKQQRGPHACADGSLRH